MSANEDINSRYGGLLTSDLVGIREPKRYIPVDLIVGRVPKTVEVLSLAELELEPEPTPAAPTVPVTEPALALEPEPAPPAVPELPEEPPVPVPQLDFASTPELRLAGRNSSTTSAVNNNASFALYSGAWLRNPAIRALTPTERDCFLNILCLMNECEPRGMLALNGYPMNNRRIAMALNVSEAQFVPLLHALLDLGLLHQDEPTRVIYSRRMMRGSQIKEQQRKTGKLGGNPNLLIKFDDIKRTTRAVLKSGSLLELFEERSDAAYSGSSGSLDPHGDSVILRESSLDLAAVEQELSFPVFPPPGAETEKIPSPENETQKIPSPRNEIEKIPSPENEILSIPLEGGNACSRNFSMNDVVTPTFLTSEVSESRNNFETIETIPKQLGAEAANLAKSSPLSIDTSINKPLSISTIPSTSIQAHGSDTEIENSLKTLSGMGRGLGKEGGYRGGGPEGGTRGEKGEREGKTEHGEEVNPPDKSVTEVLKSVTKVFRQIDPPYIDKSFPRATQTSEASSSIEEKSHTELDYPPYPIMARHDQVFVVRENDLQRLQESIGVRQRVGPTWITEDWAPTEEQWGRCIAGSGELFQGLSLGEIEMKLTVILHEFREYWLNLAEADKVVRTKNAQKMNWYITFRNWVRKVAYFEVQHHAEARIRLLHIRRLIANRENATIQELEKRGILSSYDPTKEESIKQSPNAANRNVQFESSADRNARLHAEQEAYLAQLRGGRARGVQSRSGRANTQNPLGLQLSPEDLG
jgi:hypothetical protein